MSVSGKLLMHLETWANDPLPQWDHALVCLFSYCPARLARSRRRLDVDNILKKLCQGAGQRCDTCCYSTLAGGVATCAG